MIYPIFWHGYVSSNSDHSPWTTSFLLELSFNYSNPGPFLANIFIQHTQRIDDYTLSVSFEKKNILPSLIKLILRGIVKHKVTLAGFEARAADSNAVFAFEGDVLCCQFWDKYLTIFPEKPVNIQFCHIIRHCLATLVYSPALSNDLFSILCVYSAQFWSPECQGYSNCDKPRGKMKMERWTAGVAIAALTQ